MYGVCTGVCGWVQVCGGVRWYAIVFTGVPRCFWVCAWGCEFVRVCMGMLCLQVCVCVFRYVYASMHGACSGKCKCVWDEFSEYLLETRVLTSADFNTYPI